MPFAKLIGPVKNTTKREFSPIFLKYMKKNILFFYVFKGENYKTSNQETFVETLKNTV